MIKVKPSTIAIHIISWLLFFSLPVVFIISHSDDGRSAGFLLNPVKWISFLFYVFVFYFHTYYLFPKLYLHKNAVLYFFSLIVLLAAVFFIRPFDRLADHGHPPQFAHFDNNHAGPVFKNGQPSIQQMPGHPEGIKVDIVSIVLFILTLALSITWVVEKRRRRAELQAANTEIDKANAELSFLRAQVNPHFLFNTLNNIYSLAVTKNDNVADAIMKLSNIMRYVTDEAEERYVPLQKEVDVISDFIGLQKLRLGKKVTVDFEVTGDIEQKKIAPLILMAFVENVFKYGISNSEACEIIIKLGTTDKQILFFTENKLFDSARATEREGIGHSNTKKRLEFLYPNKHLLDITTENGLFTVQLVLNS